MSAVGVGACLCRVLHNCKRYADSKAGVEQMTKMQQFTCPECGMIGADPVDMPRPPLCHVCKYLVEMKPSQNGKIIMTKKIVEFRGEQCRVEFAKYGNGRIAIRLLIDETGEPMATASSNLVGEEIEPNQTHIKDHSENSGILEVLVSAGIVKDTGVKHRSGFCEYALVNVL